MDFEAPLKDGHGIDWPIRYPDIQPWYDYVERFIGVNGEPMNSPAIPDGIFQKPMEMNAAEKHIRKQIEENFPGRTMTMFPMAILTEPLNGRAPCHYCGPCMRGCSTGSYFSSQSCTLPAAEATGNMTLRPNSVVHSIIYDETKDLATGVRVVDALTKEMIEYHGKLIFLCASTLGSTQILLNTKTPRFPDGLANSSGTLGHYLMDHHFRVGARGILRGFEDRYYQGNRPAAVYVPRFRNVSAATTHPIMCAASTTAVVPDASRGAGACPNRDLGLRSRKNSVIRLLDLRIEWVWGNVAQLRQPSLPRP